MTRISSALLASVALSCLSACASSRGNEEFDVGAFQQWREEDAEYRLFPGDTVQIDIINAPEYSGPVTVAPDGRAPAPLFGPVMLAGKTVKEAEFIMEWALESQLIDPDVELRATGFGSQQIFVGGEVNQPGLYALPGDIGALEAVMLAGGFRTSARRSQVAILRRAPGGGAMLRAADLRSGVRRGEHVDSTRLQRFDIIYVPRSSIAEVNLFMQQYVRDALPIQFGFFYDFSNQN